MVLPHAMSLQSTFIMHYALCLLSYHFPAFIASPEVCLKFCTLTCTVLLVSSAPGFVFLSFITPSSAALETLHTAQIILRNTALLQFPRKSDKKAKSFARTSGMAQAKHMICRM